MPGRGIVLYLTGTKRGVRYSDMKEHIHIVKSIVPGSIADEMGIEPGDRLISINGQEIEDIFDYQFYSEDEELLLLVEKPDG